MNIFLWVVQGLLAIHTAMGAVWKFSHSPAQTMPSLEAIPGGLWLAMSALEILCSLCLLLPFINKSLGALAPAASVFIALEMLLLCGLHLSSGSSNVGPMIYWLVVGVISGFVAYARYALAPI